MEQCTITCSRRGWPRWWPASTLEKQPNGCMQHAAGKPCQSRSEEIQIAQDFPTIKCTVFQRKITNRHAEAFIFVSIGVPQLNLFIYTCKLSTSFAIFNITYGHITYVLKWNSLYIQRFHVLNTMFLYGQTTAVTDVQAHLECSRPSAQK